MCVRVCVKCPHTFPSMHRSVAGLHGGVHGQVPAHLQLPVAGEAHGVRVGGRLEEPAGQRASPALHSRSGTRRDARVLVVPTRGPTIVNNTSP